MAQIAHVGVRHPGLLTCLQLPAQPGKLPVKADPGQHRRHRHAPANGRLYVVRMGGDLLGGEGDEAGPGLCQLEGELARPAQGHADIRLPPVVLVPGAQLIRAVPPLGQGGALGGEAVQHLPPQGVERGKGHRQPVLHQGADLRHPVRGAPRFGELALHLRAGGGPAAGGLRHVPRGGDHPALAVLHPHLERLAGADHGVKLHRHAGALPLLIGRTGLGEQLPGVLGLLPDAEHVRPLFLHKIAVGKALAGEGLLQLGQLLRRGLPALPQGVGVHTGHNIDVFRPLHPPLDLGAGHAQLLQLLEMASQRHVLEGERVAVRPVPPAVGQAAGLGAHAPVAAAPADDAGHEALPRVAHAQRPVDEHLDLNGGALADIRDVPAGQLPGQHRPGHAQPGGLLHPVQGVEGHLGGGVQRQVGGALAQRAHQPHVLHQHRVRPQLGRLDGAVHRLGHLPV